MSLVRLLTAGKSLVGLKDNGNRYRVTSQRLLPKFNTKELPTKMNEPDSDTVSVDAGGQPQAPNPAPISVGPSTTASGPVRSDRSGSRWFGGIWPISWLNRSKVSRSAVSPFSKALVQPELLLESVKVIRNDLSDSDLEIVTAKGPKATGQSTPAAPAQSRARATLAKMTGRLFMAGKQ